MVRYPLIPRFSMHCGGEAWPPGAWSAAHTSLAAEFPAALCFMMGLRIRWYSLRLIAQSTLGNARRVERKSWVQKSMLDEPQTTPMPSMLVGPLSF